ncbi:phosphatase PAP2 family protein [Evansella clarkii]|uniref:phosphatase PAP2 family protein n=1 Tax=Evansella clarkii TaxID=79879 RepID=UPI00143170E2|nr:phosphatase PAP2 family protein [Evansella clarkii]
MGFRFTVNKEERKYIYSAAAMLALFTVIFFIFVEGYADQEFHAFDLAVIELIQAPITDRMTELMTAITHVGSVPGLAIFAIAVALLVTAGKNYKEAVLYLAACGAGGMFNWLLKLLFQRERPQINPLLEVTGHSFPSGHSMGTMVVYGLAVYLLLILVRRRWVKITGTILLIAGILLIGLSRIYLGVHYPSDVIGGFTAGAAWVLFCTAILETARKNH